MLRVHLLASAGVTPLRARILSRGDSNLKIKLSQILKFKLMFNVCEKVALKAYEKPYSNMKVIFFKYELCQILVLHIYFNSSLQRWGFFPLLSSSWKTQ